MKNPIKTTCFLLVSIALCSCLNGSSGANDKDDGQQTPPFPQLFDRSTISERRIHVISEVLSNEGGYETHEEFVDFDKTKMALVISNARGKQVTYIDAESNLIFQYEPYTCVAKKPEEIVAKGNENLWHADMGVGVNGKTFTFHLYGLIALWFNVGPMDKSYKKVEEIYVASKNIVRPVHRWSIKATKEIYHFHFYDSNQQGDRRYSLEMVQVESIETSKITKTMNILKLDYWLPREEYDSILQVPLGYNCIDGDATKKALVDYPSLSDIYLGPLRDHSHKLKLEVTKTWQNSDGKRLSSTLSAEVARTNVTHNIGGGIYQLARYRTSSKDIKTIVGYQFNTKHTIDMRRGTCEISNLLRDERDSNERVQLRFDNGGALDLDLDMMRFLFTDTLDFYYVKTVGKEFSKRYMYFEKAEYGKIFSKKPTRIIRKYVLDRTDKSIILDSVSIWVLDKDAKKIVETYQINILESASIISTAELARLFDVSNECYLNNDKMIMNQDYAWFELTYPIASHQANLLADTELEIKEQFYNKFLLEGGLSPMRIPKMELMFEDTVMIVRILLLDLPSLTVLYDLWDGYTIESKDREKEFNEVASDVEHCAEYCRFYMCRLFSFNELDHSCIIQREIITDWKGQMAKKKGCKSYSISILMPADYSKLNLHSQLALLQHQDYGAIALPKMPDELIYPRSETGISDSDFKKAVLDYVALLYDFLLKEGHRLPMLTLTMTLDGHLIILLPNKFEVEQDPLAEFDSTAILYKNKDFDEDRVPAFHHGAGGLRYKINVVDPSKQKNWRLFNGLSYDQCALACRDGKCSSFSYCSMRLECIVTDNYEVSSSMRNSFVEEDIDCFIAQRDYLSKFNAFPNVFRPAVYRSKRDTFNPSECAHACVAETDFNCLAFDYCESSPNTCYFLDNRLMHGSTDVQERGSKKGGVNVAETGCTHYSRSILADFTRIEYRELLPEIRESLVRTTYRSLSVDECAEHCVDASDCTVFQFCFDLLLHGEPTRTCTIMNTHANDGKRRDKIKVVVDIKDDERILESSKMFLPNVNCHVFALRKDTFEARSRDQLIETETVEEQQAEMQQKESGSRGISLLGGLFLYVCLTLVFAGIGCGVMIAKQKNNYLGQRIERVQIALGMI